MGNENSYYACEMIDTETLNFKILPSNLDKDTATAIYDTYGKDTGVPHFSDFIMDARLVNEISDPAIGILMKNIPLMKTAKGYVVLVLNEEFLQKIMIRHPEMFNYLAVFHTIEDAAAFIKKSKKS